MILLIHCCSLNLALGNTGMNELFRGVTHFFVAFMNQKNPESFLSGVGWPEMDTEISHVNDFGYVVRYAIVNS